MISTMHSRFLPARLTDREMSFKPDVQSSVSQGDSLSSVGRREAPGALNKAYSTTNASSILLNEVAGASDGHWTQSWLTFVLIELEYASYM